MNGRPAPGLVVALVVALVALVTGLGLAWSRGSWAPFFILGALAWAALASRPGRS